MVDVHVHSEWGKRIVSEDTSTTATSEADPAASGDAGSGSAGDGGAGGTQASVSIEDLEALRRDFQSAQDKSIARITSMLDERLAPKPKDDSDDEPQPLTAEDVRREAASAVQNAQIIFASVGDLKAEFPLADPSIYSDLTRFESVEALRAAVEGSHSRTDALVAPALQEKEKEIRAKYAERYGDLGPMEPTDTTPAGDPTIEQLSRMSQPELDQLEKDNPGVIDRVLRSAN